jgi:hypothetical protein
VSGAERAGTYKIRREESTLQQREKLNLIPEREKIKI